MSKGTKKPKLAAVDATTKVSGVTMNQLLTKDFQVALSELVSAEGLTAKTSYTLVTIAEDVEKAIARFEALRMRILKKYAAKDEAGELATNEDKSAYIILDQSAFDKEYSELLSVEVNLPKVSLTSIEDVKISAPKLRYLIGTVVNPQL